MTESLGVVRYRVGERAVHAIVALTYVYLLVTGLALWTPGLYWMATVLGGGFLSRVLHPWIGAVFTLLVVWMIVIWGRDMRTTDADREWRRSLVAYIKNQDERVPAAGRFNFGQKQFFWAMVWSTAALLVSGLILWFPLAVPPSLAFTRPLAVLVHAVASLVTIAAFIVHVYMGVVVVPGGMRAIVKGDVSPAWARQHHRLWADEVMTAGDATTTSSARAPDAAGRH